ncbi:MAG: IS1182 family transposase [Anaerolineaceae bacterium]|nr:IS1182 family transposase [Anaerolineaceae bacterium]
MCLKVQPPWPMPTETATVGQVILKADSPYRLIGDKLFGQFSEDAYADLYSPEGKPGLSPVILAFVTVFQFMERLPDRQAAESLRMRMDWKYALHLPLTYEGFDFSVLSEFRDRLIEHDAEGRVFETLVAAFREVGLIKERGKQRTDSIAMLTKVRRLSRLELVVETLRMAVGALVKADREWSAEIIPPSWEERYGERFVMQRYSEKEWKEYEAHIGEDGQWLLTRFERGGAPADLKGLLEVQILRTVWAQQFREAQGKLAYQDLKKYDGKTQIQTPHDPEARYSRKRHAEWVGDKVQLTETDDKGYPHLITDIVGTGSNLTDYEELSPIQQRLEERRCKPAEHYVDAGYMSGPNLKESQNRQIDLIGPLSSVVTPQDRLPDGITQAQFKVDVENNRVTCPQGHTVGNPTPMDYSLRFQFPKQVCAACEVRSRCCTGKGGRTIGINAHYEQVQAARKQQRTEAFKKDYHQHRSGVEGSLSALVSGNGLRVGRYIGQKKRHLQAVFTGCAANLKRTASWQAGKRPQIRHKGWGLAAA